jgi:hypothetical protein
MGDSYFRPFRRLGHDESRIARSRTLGRRRLVKPKTCARPATRTRAGCAHVTSRLGRGEDRVDGSIYVDRLVFWNSDSSHFLTSSLRRPGRKTGAVSPSSSTRPKSAPATRARECQGVSPTRRTLSRRVCVCVCVCECGSKSRQDNMLMWLLAFIDLYRK